MAYIPELVAATRPTARFFTCLSYFISVIKSKRYVSYVNIIVKSFGLQ
jgi:hypothetical protein